MVHQAIIIPRKPEEVAAALVGMDEKELCVVKGFILGLCSRHPQQARSGQRREGT